MWHHFVELESSESKINKGLDLWAASVVKFGGAAMWKSAAELYKTIDTIQHGNAPWKTYSFHYKGPLPPTPPLWMMRTYELCTRNTHQVLQQQFTNPNFKDKINYTPYMQFNQAGKRVWSNFMSGDWAWKQAVSDIHFEMYMISNLLPRISSWRILVLMDRSSYPLWLEVIRRLCLLQLGTRSITLHISHPEIS